MRLQPHRIHPGEGDHHAGEAHRVDQEDPPGADGHDEQPGHRRPDDPREVERHRVQRHGIADLTDAHELGHERLADRHVQRREAADQQAQQVDVPQRHHAGDVGQAQREGAHPERDLERDEHPALVDAIGEHPAPEREQQCRGELGRGRQPQRGGVATGQVQHEPVLRHALHPGADQRDDLTGGVAPVVRHPQRGEHPAAGRRGLRRRAHFPLGYTTIPRRAPGAARPRSSRRTRPPPPTSADG